MSTRIGTFKRYLKFLTIPVPADRGRELRLFQRVMGIRFSNVPLLNISLVHKSYANEKNIERANNERLELLGDAVLGLVITDHLFREKLNKSEGYLAKCKSHIVSEDILAQIALELTVDNYLLIGKGEELSGGRLKKAILSDTLEAIIGAYYLDSGFECVTRFIIRIFQPEVTKVFNDEHVKDYKSLLQERVQQMNGIHPHYRVVKRGGPEHRQIFSVEVVINDIAYAVGDGPNKKAAEKEAARKAFLNLAKEV